MSIYARYDSSGMVLRKTVPNFDLDGRLIGTKMSDEVAQAEVDAVIENAHAATAVSSKVNFRPLLVVLAIVVAAWWWFSRK